MTECQHHAQRHVHGHEHGTLVADPVCGMRVDARSAEHRYKLGGTAYYFCSARCLDKLRADPDLCLNTPGHDPAVQAPAVGALPQAPEWTI